MRAFFLVYFSIDNLTIHTENITFPHLIELWSWSFFRSLIWKWHDVRSVDVNSICNVITDQEVDSRLIVKSNHWKVILILVWARLFIQGESKASRGSQVSTEIYNDLFEVYNSFKGYNSFKLRWNVKASKDDSKAQAWQEWKKWWMAESENEGQKFLFLRKVAWRVFLRYRRESNRGPHKKQ